MALRIMMRTTEAAVMVEVAAEWAVRWWCEPSKQEVQLRVQAVSADYGGVARKRLAMTSNWIRRGRAGGDRI